MTLCVWMAGVLSCVAKEGRCSCSRLRRGLLEAWCECRPMEYRNAFESIIRVVDETIIRDRASLRRGLSVGRWSIRVPSLRRTLIEARSECRLGRRRQGRPFQVVCLMRAFASCGRISLTLHLTLGFGADWRRRQPRRRGGGGDNNGGGDDDDYNGGDGGGVGGGNGGTAGGGWWQPRVRADAEPVRGRPVCGGQQRRGGGAAGGGGGGGGAGERHRRQHPHSGGLLRRVRPQAHGTSVFDDKPPVPACSAVSPRYQRAEVTGHILG